MHSDLIGGRLRHFMHQAAPFFCIAIALLWHLADASYAAGSQLRLALEERSQQLAALHLHLLGLTAPEPQSIPPMTLSVPIAEDPELTAFRCRLNGIDLSLNVSQLRALARERGHRGNKVSRARRSDLLLLLSKS
jgi:hypothetical protein